MHVYIYIPVIHINLLFKINSLTHVQYIYIHRIAGKIGGILIWLKISLTNVERLAELNLAVSLISAKFNSMPNLSAIRYMHGSL